MHLPIVWLQIKKASTVRQTSRKKKEYHLLYIVNSERSFYDTDSPLRYKEEQNKNAE